jgi:hypothetical protein
MPALTRFTIAVGLVCMVIGGLIGASPRAGAQGVPDYFACYDVEPLDLLDLLNMVDDLDTVSATGEALTVSVWGPSLEVGPAISFTERAQIAAVLESLVSCINQQDAARIFSMLSGRYQALLVMDLLSGGDALAAIAQQIPVILDSPDATEPLSTPVIKEAWRQFAGAENIWTVVSMDVPGYSEPVSFFIAFAPGANGWQMDEIAVFEE